ncbi:MAG: NAD-dependent epimerase/dehydratase family protein [Myxococcaceae bacterium]|nr:NAD-dependent epimerase/dehydratase family protein [Myxococcaceae bacterium]
MRLFVTGGSGFVGGAFIKAAVAQGHAVLAMARSDASAKAVEALGASAVRCELGAVPASALQGVEAVVHAAAHTEEFGPRDVFWKVNVEGTEQLLEAAREAKVPRFVLVSTEAVLFMGKDLHDVDESYPYPRFTPFLYSETKAAAEQRVLAANAPGFTTLAVRPRMVWGPGDVTILPAVAAMVRSGAFRWIDRGRARTHTTHIANAVHGLMLALTRGAGGKAYFVTDDEETTIKDFFTQYLATQGLTPPEASVPSWVAEPLAAGLERLWSLTGRKGKPPLTKLAVTLMTKDCLLNIDRARQELGYAPQVSLAEGLKTMPRPA